MQIAVLADIHGNYIALQKCIEYALDRGVSQFIFLGDYVGELAYPQKTMDILYSLQKEYKCYFVKGNKEDYWIDYEANGKTGWKEYDSTTGALYYAYNQLTEKDMNFFKSLSFAKNISIENFPLMTICHGSPRKVNEKMLKTKESTYEIMDNSETSLILCGHSHEQEEIKHNGKIVLNAGSVGVSLRAGGKAQFLLLKSENDNWDYEFISLEYDTLRVINELDESGMSEYAPSWTAVTKHVLQESKVSHAMVLVRAMELCEQEQGKCIWPDIPEKYWKTAVDEIRKNSRKNNH